MSGRLPVWGAANPKAATDSKIIINNFLQTQNECISDHCMVRRHQRAKELSLAKRRTLHITPKSAVMSTFEAAPPRPETYWFALFPRDTQEPLVAVVAGVTLGAHHPTVPWKTWNSLE